MTPCPHEHFTEIKDWVRKTHGWRIHEGRKDDGTLEQRKRYFADVDATAINGGNRHYELHVRGPDGWETRPDFARCKEILTAGKPSLVELPAVFVGACRMAPEKVWICGRDGQAVVTRSMHDNGPAYRYDVESGDPLGYMGDANLAEFVTAGWHDSRAWLMATAGARCPDTVAQIVEYFDSPRSPDIVLFAVEGWDFAEENVGGHGSIVRRDMWVPMVFAGPGLRRGQRLPVARVCDVAPTIVELLAGRERLNAMGRIDGVSLVSQLREAASDARQQ
jgi:hypothetical protein